MIVQLVYISTHSGDRIDNIPDFLLDAYASNFKNGITSIILTSNEYYLHVIEGSRCSVNKLYNRICKDIHHTDCCILRYAEIPKPEFPDCVMVFSNIHDFIIDGINSIGNIDKFRPEVINASSAMALLRRAAAHHRAS